MLPDDLEKLDNHRKQEKINVPDPVLILQRKIKKLEAENKELRDRANNGRLKITEKDVLEFLFIDGENQVSAYLPFSTIKNHLIDEAIEIISTPECNNSTCSVSNFCECDPINENMELSGIYINIEKPPKEDV